MFNRYFLPFLTLTFISIQSIHTSVVLNLTSSSEKLLCYSCKGSSCEAINNEEDNIILCNRYTQLCWAGFVDQQPYRTCASRYCTPSGISLDSDVRIESCCHANLCNTISLSWPTMSKWYRRVTSTRLTSSTTQSLNPTPASTTSGPSKSQILVVNEIVDNPNQASSDNAEEQELRHSKTQLNFSDPASFGINWERVPYDKDFSNRLVSISKFVILLIPVLLVLLF